MSDDRIPGRPVARAVSRGAAPRLDDFQAAMAEAGRRKRRRGVQSAGVGAALAAVVTVVFGFGAMSGSINAGDEVTFVDAPETSDSAYDGLPGPVRLGPPVDTSTDTAVTDDSSTRRRRAGTSGTAAAPQSSPRPPAPATRASSRSLASCGSAEWCLTAGTAPAGKDRYTLAVTACLNTGVPLSSLDFPTAQEVEFELLAGQRVIWQWSDGQTFAKTPHSVSAIASECFTWRTLWSQYDGNGERVGRARLTLRARTTATQVTQPTAATSVFETRA